ncbi:RagB/SusD family nutrient uptake outer membrane protein [Arundinibacter roseus]|uniref:RagB/SusD family nutrient uptake outer membrane protein n=1 Tax=Arundinibacter roseus TaxID=2070510 RepID=A0A4R4KH41_9BACT|nr:RagB/SusD family nutrient uptake outer membrane protein [Arundinibacter roseus]TDB65941.1 RagB/SusD family nutrient uptake outer membrane protein [Arundinibacter roseus]
MRKYSFFFLAGLLGLGSCQKGFLDLAPISETNSINFYRNADDMLNAVNAAYAALQFNGQYNQAMYAFGEVRSDNTEILDAQSGIDITQVDAFTTISNNGLVNSAWNDHYRGILACNTVIDRIEGVEMNADLKRRIAGEAQFLRALMYFNLVRIFGDVPLVIKETTNVEDGYAYTRDPAEAVYTQIIKDLSEAEAKLPVSYTGNNIGRATSGAAKGLLAKVFLTQRKWAEAAAKAKEVMDLNQYQLLPNYASLFNLTNENSKESLFEVQYKKGGLGLGSPFNNRFAPRLSGVIVTTIGAGTGHNHPTADIATAYEDGDNRKAASFAPGFRAANNQFVDVRYVTKYIDPAPFAASDADNNWPVLRYADVLLMRAEALNEVGYVADGEAFTLLNQIRTRAGLAPKTSAELSTQGAFRRAVEEERRIELAFENHRWFDLVRTGRALEVMNSKGFSIDATQLLLPIPQNQIDINPDKIKQNPGY